MATDPGLFTLAVDAGDVAERLTEEDVQYLKDILLDPFYGTIIVMSSFILNMVLMIGGVKLVEKWVIRQSWWESCKPLQAALCQNFGYREKDITDKVLQETYCQVTVASTHHAALGLLCVPVILSGGRSGYLCLVIACVGAFGFDLSDWCRMAATLCCAESLGLAPTPIMLFIIMGVCHHFLSITLVLPMLLHYMTLASFHFIVCSLLLAAGIAYMTGNYKFTLNTSEESGLRRYKCIVVIQLVTIYVSRGLIWFWCMTGCLRTFAADGEDVFWWGGLIFGSAMTVFNLILVVDCTLAAIKWLPRLTRNRLETPTELEEHHTEIPEMRS